MTTIFDIPGSNAPNSFSAHIQAILDDARPASGPEPRALDERVAQLVTMVNDSSDPANALWQLWDAFFTAVISATSHAPHLALLDAMRAQPPTQPSNIPAGSDAKLRLRSYINSDGVLDWSSLPRFNAQWRDVHDVLEAWRDWDGVRTSGVGEDSTTSALSSSGDQYFLRFCLFSAAQLKAAEAKGDGHPIWVFYACRSVLEREGPEPRQERAHRMSTEEVWALDVRLAATWMRDGGRALWDADPEGLRRHWVDALDDKTELWPREDGLTRERWQLWGKRLRALGGEGGGFDEETRAVVKEAADVVEGLLREKTT